MDLKELKLLQNKKGQKKFEVPSKKAVFFLRKGLLFCQVPQIFFGPSYFEMALVSTCIFILF